MRSCIDGPGASTRDRDRLGTLASTGSDGSVRSHRLADASKNPLIAASGCFGYGVEYADVVDLSSLGGVAVKGLFLAEREGHPPPRIVETPAGMLNAIGLQGIGVHRFVDEKLPELRARRATVIVNVCGTTLDEYVEVARILSDAEGVARDRAEHLVPEHQGRRHPVRLQPAPAPTTSSAPCAR